MFPAKLPCQLRPGHLLNGKYQIEEELGAGGFGCVYVAENLNLHTRVAIKLRREAGPDARLWREAQIAAALQSPHSVRIFDVDRLEDGTPYIVMELLEGQTLRDYLRVTKKAPLERAVTWALQICSALREAHAAGLVHRDIKPSNLFLVGSTHAQAHVKLVDFGLAKHVEDASFDTVTDSDVIVGSPAYMAPERVRAGAGTPQTDIWSVGVVLFQMLTGRLPFEGETNSALLASIVADPPRPLAELAPELPPAVGAVIARCLRKRPEDRYASVDTLVHDLRHLDADTPVRLLNDDSITASATVAQRPSGATSSLSSRGRLLFAAGLIGVPLMVGSFALFPVKLWRTEAAGEAAVLPTTPSARTILTSSATPRTSVSSAAARKVPDDGPSVEGAVQPPPRPRASVRNAPGAAVRSQQRAQAPASAPVSSAPIPSAGPASASAIPRLFTEPDF